MVGIEHVTSDNTFSTSVCMVWLTYKIAPIFLVGKSSGRSERLAHDQDSLSGTFDRLFVEFREAKYQNPRVDLDIAVVKFAVLLSVPLACCESWRKSLEEDIVEDEVVRNFDDRMSKRRLTGAI